MTEEKVARAGDSPQVRYTVEIHMWRNGSTESRQIFFHRIDVDTVESIKVLAMQVKP